MRDEVVEKYYDVLQNIELAILTVYEEDAELLDLEVIDALDGLVRRYAAEEQARTPPALRLSERATGVHLSAQRVCEWRMGRAALEVREGETDVPEVEVYSLADILVCLKRIRKSVKYWNEQAGRQGYLEYISGFLG
jgi:hypothetical protein